MKRRPHHAAAKAQPKATPARPRTPTHPHSRKRLWVFAASSALLSPLLLFLLVEMVLRLVGFGHPASFLLPARIKDQEVFIQNDRFGWRFFGPDLARQPSPLIIPKLKAPNVIRVFVFGESAAYGDPQPEFGLPRLLEALLSARFPGTKFEVFNVAMTAINSHAVLPIARDCARHHGDIWVLYMGNNEIVGPYGPGTVFAQKTPSLAWTRSALALKATRCGQALERAVARLRPRSFQEKEWGGMQMFLKHRVRSDDPSLTVAYSNFARNLGDILALGRACGAKIVVSSVASNLKDCAPFASQHRKDLTAAELTRWDELYRSAVDAQTKTDPQRALEYYGQAAHIDDTFADLHFRRAQYALALGQDSEALREFTRARDEDTLRFRCDSRLNRILAQVASGQEQQGILFSDVQPVLAQSSQHGVPGAECFYEHVHLTFEGNYRLGLTLAQQVARLLPATVTSTASTNHSWPSIDDCARRLAWTDWSRHQAVLQILGRLEDPPFTTQLNSAEQKRRLREQLEQVMPATQPSGLQAAASQCRQALAISPNDWQLLQSLAQIEEAFGDVQSAADSWRRVTDMLPYQPELWEAFGNALAKARHPADARAAFEQALRLDPNAIAARTGVGQLLLAERNYLRASQQFEQALKIKPYWCPAHLGLGKAYEALGRDSDAQAQFQAAMKDRINTFASFNALGQVCFEKKWYDQAATNFTDALRLNPADAATHVNLGMCLGQLGRHAEAGSHFAEAVRLDPNLAEAHARLGLEFGRQGNDAGAVEKFAEAIRLKPESIEVRLNLGIALSKQQRLAEARQQFQEVLRRSPTNQIALKYLR